MVGYKGQFKNDPVYDTDRIGELTSIWSDHLIGRPENHMTGVSFTRGGYHRIGKRVTNGAGGYTVYRPDHWIFDGTGIDYGDVLGASADRPSATSATAATSPSSTGCPYPTGSRRHARELRDPRRWCPPPTSPARPPPARRSRTSRPRSSSSPPACSTTASEAAVERIAHGQAMLGSYTSPGGGTVITSGSTDWAHGLAGRDAQIEQITANILDRLG